MYASRCMCTFECEWITARFAWDSRWWKSAILMFTGNGSWVREPESDKNWKQKAILHNYSTTNWQIYCRSDDNKITWSSVQSTVGSIRHSKNLLKLWVTYKSRTCILHLQNKISKLANVQMPQKLASPQYLHDISKYRTILLTEHSNM